MRAVPREVGRRLHTEGVMAGTGCSASPNFSSDSGCTCHSMLGVASDGSLFANAPSCDGGIVSGPVLKRRYSSAMAALPNQRLARSFSVGPLTFHTMRIWRWSWRLPPTPSSACATGTPRLCSSSPGPIPETCSRCGEPIDPAARITAFSALARSFHDHVDADRAPPLEEHLPHVRFRDDGEVGPRHRRPQPRLGRAPAHAAALVHVEVRVAEIVAAVEFLDLRDAAFLGGFAPRVQDLPAHARLFYAELALTAMVLVGAAEMPLRALEVGQHFVPRPAAVAERGPVVVIALLAAHVHHP